MKKELGVLLCFLGFHKVDKKTVKIVSYDRYETHLVTKCVRCKIKLYNSK